MKLFASLLYLCVSFLCATNAQLSNHWILQTTDDESHTHIAKRIAEENNFKIVKTFQLNNVNYHIAQPDHHRLKRSLDSPTDVQINDLIQKSEQTILSDPSVSLFEREKVLKRTKRDYVGNNDLAKKQLHQNLLERIQREYYMRQAVRPNLKRLAAVQDPMWPDMWYLNRHSVNSDLPDMNVTGAWSQGYSGRGVSVTFLDDGLEHDHPDIKQNYDANASDDINGNDSDPMPRYDDLNENKHGTRCAGEVAAAANNSICSVGVAFNAGIGGIRMLDGDVTDTVEARSLSFNRDHIDIYSASWGPDDNGEVVDGPGAFAKQAFIEGVNLGRKGLGSIFVWASGNGGRFSDSCSCDGYANSIYTLSISSTSENSEKPWYLEECTSTLATTYSSGDERMHEHEVVTTDLRHQCTSKHTGTSAAAPIAAGIIALTLEANSKLTWRDIMYLIVLTSRPKAIKSNNFIVNQRGFLVSSRYGFGLMDAGRMVELAKNWQNVPTLRSCQTINSNFKINTVQKVDALEAVLTTDACFGTDSEVNFIEQVEIVVSIQAPIRGNLEMYLTSPMGTRSLILPKRPKDQSVEGFKRWPFMTVQLWGEMPQGEWKLVVASSDQNVRLEDFNLIIHGTKEKPIEYENLLNMKSVICNYECSQIGGLSCGPNEYECFKCAHYSLEIESNKIKCVSLCPSGYYASDSLKKCLKCDPTCVECKGNSSLDCVKCNDNKVLDPLTTTCETSCSEGFFINSKMECEQCGLDCKKCEYEANQCTACNGDDIFTNNACLSKQQIECDVGTFFDFNKNECGNCDITCSECQSISSRSCLTCPPKRPFLKLGQCVASCGDSYYLDQSRKKCLPCNENCLNCEKTSTKCIQCKPGFKLNQSNCLPNLLNEKVCGENCLECYKDADWIDSNPCLTCKNGHGLLERKCYETSPKPGYYKMEQKTNRGIKFEFEQCKRSCLECKDKMSCSKCSDGFYLSNNECLKVCDPKSYSNEFGDCTPCSSPCDKCSNETFCLTCETNMKVLNGQCVQNCPIGYYTKDSTCLACHPSCLTCNGSTKKDCLSCDDGLIMKNYKCLSNCPDGTFYDTINKECTVCSTNNCSSCVKTATTCTKCFSPFVLDEATFTCKQCCSRSIHGKVKANSCCYCPEIYNGYCSVQSDLKNTFIFGISFRKETTNKFALIFTILFVILSVFLFLYSIVSLRKTCKKNQSKFASVEYRPLNET